MPELISFRALTGAQVRAKITDVGASFLGEQERPQFAGLLERGDVNVIGFEPSLKWLKLLLEQKGPYETYLPYAIGDGRRHTLHICQAPGMTSLLEPNPEILKLFHLFPKWGTVVSTIELDTVRLDDVKEAVGTDMLKLDIQGAELMALQNTVNVLKETLIVHTEAEFLQLYKNQPLFSDIDQFLRSQGFVFHRFHPLVSRTIVPIVKDGSIFNGISQIVWSDAVFVRDFSRLDLFSDAQLLKTAMLVHECYGSADLANHLLLEYDRRNRSNFSNRYLGGVLERGSPLPVAPAA